MIGLVVVSHSRPLAEAAVALARQMVSGGEPEIAVAAGLDDGRFGTDAAAIALAIAAVDSPDGVLVLLDLGSALLSAELAVEFLADDLAERVQLSPAPLVEGLLAAVVQAATGASLAAVAAEARGALLTKAAHLDGAQPVGEVLQVPRRRSPERIRPLVWRTTVRNPHGIHIRPAAAIVTELRDLDAEVLLSNASSGRGPAEANSLSRITALELRQGEILEARFSGPQAQQAKDALTALAARDFGEDLNRQLAQVSMPSRQPALVLPPAAERRAVIGRIKRVAQRPSLTGYRPLAPKDELGRFTRAVDEVTGYLAGLGHSGAALPGIIEAQQAILADRELHHGVVSDITRGFSAIEAVDRCLTELAGAFDDLSDAYLRERGQDLRSIRRLLQLALLQLPLHEPAPARPCIWLVDELDVATVTQLDDRSCLGVLSIQGGVAGHGMLTAQARGIPVLAGHPRAVELVDDQLVAFDPVTRELWPEVTERLRAELAARSARRATTALQAADRASEPAITRTGRRIIVGANVGSLGDAQLGRDWGADRAGLVRSEMLFSADTAAPDAELQAEEYLRLARILPGPLAVRTWDPSDDKPLAFLPFRGEGNPALGERGIRAMRHYPELFAEQLRAISLAARQAPMQVLLPMVTDPEEVVWARSILAEVRAELGGAPVPLGVMVEVPAAAIRAGDFAELADFVSIGTNDLTQYTQAADRTNAEVCDLARQDAPAVLDLIAATCRALPGISVGVCGDLASDPGQTARLLGLGVAELSVRPQLVPEVKQAVRQC